MNEQLSLLTDGALPGHGERAVQDKVVRDKTLQAERTQKQGRAKGDVVVKTGGRKAGVQDVAQLSARERKQWQAIDVLLAGKPDEFRATVFELCRQLGWPDDEPGFLLAIASGQLQALMKGYPERMAEVMQDATAGAFEQWQAVQAKLNLSAARQETALGALDAQLVQVQEAALVQVQEAQQVFEQEREVLLAELAQERDAVAALMERERGELARERRALMTLMEN